VKPILQSTVVTDDKHERCNIQSTNQINLIVGVRLTEGLPPLQYHPAMAVNAAPRTPHKQKRILLASGGDNTMIFKGILHKLCINHPKSMNIGIRQTRILAPFLSRTLQLTPHRSIHAYGRLHIKFPTSSPSNSFGAEGNLGIAPKTMSPIQNLTLNDGNEIPLVQHPSREQ
jgi:hypothetical protein